MRWTDDSKAFLGLGGALLVSCSLLVGFGSAPSQPLTNGSYFTPTISPAGAHAHFGDTLIIRSTGGGALCLAQGADGAFSDQGDRAFVRVAGDDKAAARIMSIPISLNWRHPLAGLPSAQVLRVAERDGRGRRGPEKLHTILFADHGDLPVLSLVMPHGALFDPDTGLMVVGNGIFHAPERVLTAEYRDPRWWKYPGNFHMRGKAWERKGRVQLIGTDGQELFQCAVGVRINGQMTRAFPQHALRLSFPEPLLQDLFGEPVQEGYASVVVRAAGNDQIKAMLRDAFQHDLCKGLPFEVSGHRTCVVYLNGSYWGVHHIRPRMDEDELARRYAISKKDITILEDEARLYRGDTMQVIHFEQLATRTADWDGTGTAWSDTLHARMDVDGFLAYMATQMILGNVDWPSQNVKFWRYSGKPRAERPLDGRWYFIMGDSDLGYGVYSSANADMFAQVNAMDVPITRLFHGMMRNALLRDRFIDTARSLAKGAFSAARSTQRLEAIAALMEPEMPRHTARWRRPSSMSSWKAHVDIMRIFAKEREAEVLRQLETFERSGD